MTLKEFLEGHGIEKFRVENGYLTNKYNLPAELSMNELRQLRDAEWARIKVDDVPHEEVHRPDSLWSALRQEIHNRQSTGRAMPIPDTSDLDKTYIYPGDPAPEGMKWVLVEDDSPGVVAYVEPENGWSYGKLDGYIKESD